MKFLVPLLPCPDDCNAQDSKVVCIKNKQLKRNLFCSKTQNQQLGGKGQPSAAMGRVWGQTKCQPEQANEMMGTECEGPK